MSDILIIPAAFAVAGFMFMCVVFGPPRGLRWTLRLMDWLRTAFLRVFYPEHLPESKRPRKRGVKDGDPARIAELETWHAAYQNGFDPDRWDIRTSGYVGGRDVSA